MSDDEGMQFNRRSVLAGTAALGLAGTSTAVAKLGANSRVADYDDDSTVDWGTNAWPQMGSDNGRTYYNEDGSGPRGTLTDAWTVDASRNLNEGPAVADGIVYTILGSESTGEQHLKALDAEDGSEQWSRKLTNQDPEGWYEPDEIVVADGDVYVTRRCYTEVYDASDGTKLWSQERGGIYPVVTDELLVAVGEETGGADEEPILVALSRADGSVQWTHEFKYYDKAQLASVGGTLYAAASDIGTEDNSKVVSLAPETGEIEWSTNLGVMSHVVATETGILATTEAAVHCLTPETGEHRWSKEGSELSDDDPRYIDLLAVGDGIVYISDDRDLNAFDLATGEQLWSVVIANEGNLAWTPGSLAVAGDTLYYGEMKVRDYDEIHYRDAKTGDYLGTSDVPDTSTNGDDGNSGIQADLVVVDGTIYTTVDEKVVALREASNDGDGESGDDGGGDSDGDEDSGSDC
ncbi:outer membrane protein assembly factor BamB family protein [Halorussus halophilus]|uniref:outer membrane protein assembly factor BamB family protein n=1 Tax=Halorussus halophilus TaxID=2650975 RepID=UPI001300D363|nr:PQQ-binding-like beta-propeller repeat protein [Halorussus halophilus]